MRSLLWKEARSLVPFMALVLFFSLLSWVELFFVKFPDQYPLHELIRDNDTGAVMSFVIAFALASGLLMRERDDRTLDFLDALPVSRVQIFLAKFALALGALWLMPLSDLVFRIVVYYWSRTSLEMGLPWQMLLVMAFLEATSCFVFLSLGLALSFLRRYSLLVVGLLVCAYLLLREAQVPWVPLFNIFTLSDVVVQGRHCLLPTRQFAVQASLGLVCAGLALGAFLIMGDSAQRFADRARRRQGVVWLAGVGTVLVVVTWIGLLVYFVKKTADKEQPAVYYTAWPRGRAQTARFQFIYPENQRGLANQLLDQADGIEERVRRFLGAPAIPRIEVDLSGSAPHTAGQAHWKKVQMDLAALAHEPESLAAVFGHETTHVYMDHESQSRLGEDFNSTRFFHEGLATYVEYRFFQSSNKLATLRRVAAMQRARQEVKFETLLDDSALSRKQDPDLVYPLGEVFLTALVRRYGEAAPGNAVRAVGRPNAPKDLKGFALWQDTLQACGYNLSDVVDAFFAELDRAVAEHRAFIDSLPRVRGGVQVEGKRIAVRATYAGQSPGTLVCRFRSRADDPERFYEYPSADDGAVFRVTKAGFTERSFWYQLGWRVPGASQPIYEPWVEAHQGQ